MNLIELMQLGLIRNSFKPMTVAPDNGPKEIIICSFYPFSKQYHILQQIFKVYHFIPPFHDKCAKLFFYILVKKTTNINLLWVKFRIGILPFADR